MLNAHPLPLSDEGYCARCDGMFSAAGFDKMRLIEGYFHSRKFDMEQTADQGCPLCQTIVSKLISDNFNDVALTFYVYSDRMGDRAAWQAWRRAIWSARGEGIEQGSGPPPRAPAEWPESLIGIDRQLYASVEIGLLAEEGE
jgi:hypothetical protein